jgi:hypothetical protein
VAANTAAEICSGISLEVTHRLELSQEDFGDPDVDCLSCDDPVDLGKLSVTVAPAVNLMGLDGGPPLRLPSRLPKPNRRKDPLKLRVDSVHIIARTLLS